MVLSVFEKCRLLNRLPSFATNLQSILCVMETMLLKIKKKSRFSSAVQKNTIPKYRTNFEYHSLLYKNKIQQDRQYTCKRNTEARSCIHCYSGKAISITYSTLLHILSVC